MTSLENEEVFLKYLIDCCENMLENPQLMTFNKVFGDPVTLQLIKLRAEVTFRLKQKFHVDYGKFATGTHLLADTSKLQVKRQ